MSQPSAHLQDDGSLSTGLAAQGRTRGTSRLWQSLMTARVALGLVLVSVSIALLSWGGTTRLMVAVCAAYAVLALFGRVWGTVPANATQFDRLWPQSVGVDVLAFASIHTAQFAGLNYAPLFIVPVLTAAMLGSGLLSMATAAGVSLFLLLHAWFSPVAGTDQTAAMLQAGLYGAGFFGLALTAHSLAQRLALEETLARTSETVARMQTLVNQLVIEALSDGVLIVDANGVVHSLNPAARRMLQRRTAGVRQSLIEAPFVLAGESAWHAIAQLVATSMEGGEHEQELTIQWADEPQRKLLARTRLVAVPDQTSLALSVVYLEDLRSIEARVRTEKLAAMGRMSAAVAHEIRNPLAAIAHANGLLTEGALQGAHPRLVKIIDENARRLGRIVDDVLSVSRGPVFLRHEHPPVLSLAAEVQTIAEEWRAQNEAKGRLQVFAVAVCQVVFDVEHLRQVLVNLLDNASRYASDGSGAICVSVESVGEHAVLSVWSDGPPIDADVQAHLFEPFSSSESRSSGLGLFISRELCELYGASMAYRRVARDGVNGNQFDVFCRLPLSARRTNSESEESTTFRFEHDETPHLGAR